MGSDLSATIFFGMPLGDPEDETDDLDFDLDEEIASNIYGIEDPCGEDEDYDEVKYRAYLDARRAAIGDKLDVDVQWSGTDGFTKQFLIIKASEIMCDWGGPEEITSPLIADPAWTERIRDLSEKLGLTYREPKWYLTALYW